MKYNQPAISKLEKLRQGYDIVELTDDCPFPIGKTYKGTKLENVPNWHLKYWLGILQHKPILSLKLNERRVLMYILDNIDVIDTA